MPLSINDKVQLANDPSRIGHIERMGPIFGGEQYFHVFWGGAHGTRTVSERDLVPHLVAATPLESLAASRFGGYAEFQRVITMQRLVRDQPLRNNVYAFNASRTRFFPYQFKPLLKFLESARSRLLICDEVGLGKTIEAGLILLELRARQNLRLVLVVCPSNLRAKWRMELRARFGEDFRILDSGDLNQFLDDYQEAPDRVSLNGIVSLETLRGESPRNRLDELGINWDLVIFDEAHHLRNFNTAQREAAALLTAGAQAAIMLTATPVHLGLENLFSLLNLLDEEDFPDLEGAQERFQANAIIVRAQSALNMSPPKLDQVVASLEAARCLAGGKGADLIQAVKENVSELNEHRRATGEPISRAALLGIQRDVAELNLLGHILTRTRKRDVQVDVAVRRARALEVQLSPPEQAFYNSVTELIRKEHDTRSDSPLIQAWRLLTPQRRLASSIQGMVEFYREGLGGETTSDDPDGFDELVEGMQSPEEAPEGELRARLSSLIRTWPLDGRDAKYEALSKLLVSLREAGRVRKVLVFATFKHTIRYLERRLSADNFRVIALSGDTKMADRPSIMDRFRDDDEVEVLLSSRVGSEGLDFQFCSTLVNYDLPWNPMEVEQRIGRLDRIGQESPSILICNLWTTGTIEERILRRLYDRIGIFTQSIGDLEAIIGEIAKDLQDQFVRAMLNPEEASTEIERVGDVIERRTHEIERLEASAAQFVGVDSFFEDEVKSIRERRRYVTGEQLLRFVTDYLRNHAPRCRLEYDSTKQIGSLTPDSQLVRLLRESGRAGDALNMISSSSVQITFDAQTAYLNPRAEFLSVLHPLVISITEFYQHFPPPTSAQHVLLRSSALEAGFYYFFVFRGQVRSARSYNSLEAIFLAEDLTLAAAGEDAETILGDMVERGESAAHPVELDRMLAMKAAAQAEIAFLGVHRDVLAREERTNDAFVDQRLASLRGFLDKSIRRKREQLKRGIGAKSKENYLRMLRGQIVNLEADRDRRANELERLRTVTSDHVSIAAGILEIR